MTRARLPPCPWGNENGGPRNMGPVWRFSRLKVAENHVCVSALETQAYTNIKPMAGRVGAEVRGQGPAR